MMRKPLVRFDHLFPILDQSIQRSMTVYGRPVLYSTDSDSSHHRRYCLPSAVSVPYITMLGHCSTECVYGNLAQPIAAPIQFIIRLIADTPTYHIQLFHQYVKLIFRTHFPGRQLQLAAVTLCPTVRPQIDWFDFPRETATRGHLQQK